MKKREHRSKVETVKHNTTESKANQKNLATLSLEYILHEVTECSMKKKKKDSFIKVASGEYIIIQLPE